MQSVRGLAYVLFLLGAVYGQTACDNYGSLNGSECACPTGFGGTTCSQPGCNGTIFDGSQRPVAPLSSGSPPLSNLTASGCTCQSGWTGTGCNVCQSASACQSGYSASGQSQSSTNATIGGTTQNQNNTLVCNTAARVWAAGQMSCQVINPTLQAIYPLSSILNILRTLQPSLTPIPNTTAFGKQNTIFGQLFYAGVEQFYCAADSCTQDLTSGGIGSADWSCQNLACTCRPGTTFCGGVPTLNLTNTINSLGGTLDVTCDAPDNSTNTAKCAFKQSVLQSLFGSSGLTLTGCTFGECVRQSVIDETGSSSSSGNNSGGSSLSGGVIAGLTVVGALVLSTLLLLALGIVKQRSARKSGLGGGMEKTGGVGVHWDDINYIIPHSSGFLATYKSLSPFARKSYDVNGAMSDKTILGGISGRVEPGQIMAILGPSGAGKTTLIEILAGKSKSGQITGHVTFPSSINSRPRIGFVPQQDILPPTLTVYEALLFAARLRLPETISDVEKQARVEGVMDILGIAALRDVRIGYAGEGGGGGRVRGISGGEMRRVSIGLELVAKPDVLILDEPTSGLDSVSASKVAQVLHDVAHDTENPTAVIASIHQPSSQLYQTFDIILVLAHGQAIYSGPGSFAPVAYFNQQAAIPEYKAGYNVADYLLEVASDPPVSLFQMSGPSTVVVESHNRGEADVAEKGIIQANGLGRSERDNMQHSSGSSLRGRYAAAFLTQLEVLSGREWKILRRDKTLFWTHVGVACVLGVFCGGLYFNTNTTIAGFQSRVGCLFFLGALIAFSSLSALYNVVEIRPLFLRERSSSYYSPTAWLLSRFLFDVIPLRLIPTIIVSTITYWMAGLAADAAHFFKFLFILVLYTLAMTLFNFLLATLFHNGGIAILLSALSALYQMTFAGFFVHLDSIPPVLRWLQWLCPLKYTLEALSVNEVGSGLMIQDTLQGVPVDVSASLIMNLLFGFGSNNYYRDVLVLFAYIAGFGLGVVGVVWLKVRERR